MPDRMPDWMPEDMSDRVPEDMPDRMPEDLPEDMPDHMPEDMPDRMPNRMSEDMSDRMPEDLPVRKCINVMVGITRSKVIGFFSHNEMVTKGQFGSWPAQSLVSFSDSSSVEATCKRSWLGRIPQQAQVMASTEVGGWCQNVEQFRKVVSLLRPFTVLFSISPTFGSKGPQMKSLYHWFDTDIKGCKIH